jgi:hypothetical protein
MKFSKSTRKLLSKKQFRVTAGGKTVTACGEGGKEGSDNKICTGTGKDKREQPIRGSSKQRVGGKPVLTLVITGQK